MKKCYVKNFCRNTDPDNELYHILFDLQAEGF